jgi:2-iminobutanoate/2-iminopropanoate deaminase
MKAIFTKDAPAPVGPYSQAILSGSLLFVSGQIALDPQTEELLTNDIKVETHTVMKNIGRVLAAAGLSYNQVLKCSIFVKDINQYSDINEVYSTYFTSDTPPARELVEVSALPKGVNIEISVIASQN